MKKCIFCKNTGWEKTKIWTIAGELPAYKPCYFCWAQTPEGQKALNNFTASINSVFGNHSGLSLIK